MNIGKKPTKNGAGCTVFLERISPIFHIGMVLFLLSACSSTENGTAVHPPDSSSVPVSSVSAPYGNKDFGDNSVSSASDGTPDPFTDKLDDDTARIDRLETVVGSIKKDVDEMVPAVKRLTKIEADLGNVVQHLETMLTKPQVNSIMQDAEVIPVEKTEQAFDPYPAASDTQAPQSLLPADSTEPASVPANTQKDTQKDTPKPEPTTPSTDSLAAAKNTVKKVRFGEHGSYTRLVLEVEGKIDYKATLDGSSQRLIIDLPDTKISGESAGSLKAGLVRSWRTEPQENNTGSRLIVELSKKADIIGDMRLDNPSRLAFDIAPL